MFQVVKREIISRDMDLTSSYLCPEQPPPLIPDPDKGELPIQIPEKKHPRGLTHKISQDAKIPIT